MKPAYFEYRSPRSIEEAVDLLGQEGEDGKVLAGGQSLVPSMNFRLARPTFIVDINRVPGLGGVEVVDGRLSVGALVRHVELERTSLTDPLGELLRRAGRCVGHLPIRIRGTFGGSLVHADPAAEWCLIAATTGAEMRTERVRGGRVIPAEDFFETVFTTAMTEDELLVEARLPLLGDGAHVGFAEFSRRAGDFALVAAAAVLWVDDGRIRAARIGLGGVAGHPVRAVRAEEVLVGDSLTPAVSAEAASAAALEVEPIGDIHGSPDYRRDLVRAMVVRALGQIERDL